LKGLLDTSRIEMEVSVPESLYSDREWFIARVPAQAFEW